MCEKASFHNDFHNENIQVLIRNINLSKKSILYSFKDKVRLQDIITRNHSHVRFFSLHSVLVKAGIRKKSIAEVKLVKCISVLKRKAAIPFCILLTFGPYCVYPVSLP